MTDNAFDPLAQQDNPYLSERLIRRAQAKDALAKPTELADTVDTVEGNWLGEVGRGVGYKLGSTVPGVELLGRRLLGDDAGADAALDKVTSLQRRERELGPQVQTLDDVNGVGDGAKWLGYQAAQLVPDVALTLTGVGAGATIARQGAKKMVERQIAGELREFAGRRGVTEAGERAATREALLARSGDELGDAMRIGRANADEALQKDIGRRARDMVGANPQDAAAIALAGRAGGVAGATAGQFPSQNVENAEILGRDGTTQADALKILAGTTAAAALGSLPAERFLGRFGDEAAAAVRANGERFAKRVGKEFAKQGLAEGSTEVAQTVAQLATHKWVDDNIDLLSPEAFDQYLTSFLAGSVMGGALGASGEVGRTGARKVGEAVQGIKPALKQFRETARSRLSELYGGINEAMTKGRRAKAGEEVPMDAPEDSSGYFKRAMDLVNGTGDKLRRGYQGASDKVRAYAFDLEGGDLDEQINQIVQKSRAFESGEIDADTPLQRSPSQNPIRVKDKLENTLLANIPSEHPAWQDEGAIREAGRALGRAFRGETLTTNDNWTLAMLLGDKSSGITREKLNTWATLGAQYPKLSESAERFANEDDSPDSELRPIDRMNSIARDLESKPDDPELRSRYDAARDEGIDEILGGKSSTWLENQNSPQASKDFKDRTRGPMARSYVSLVDKVNVGKNKEILRTKLVDLASLIETQRAKIRAEGTKNTDVPAQQALLRGLSELKQLGVEIDAKTLKPGNIYKYSAKPGAKGEYERSAAPVAYLSPAEVRAIRGELNGAPLRVGDAEWTEADGRDDPHDRQQDQIDEVDKDRILAPRSVPQGARVNEKGAVDNGRFVPGPVAEADATEPYAAMLVRARKAQENKSLTPAARGKEMHAAGYEIGMRELDAQRAAGLINERRYAKEVRELEDYSTGRSRKYLKDAAAGKFVKATYRDVKEENNDIDNEQRNWENRENEGRDWIDESAVPNPDAPRGVSETEGALAKSDVESRMQLDEDDDLGVVWADDGREGDPEKETVFVNRLLKRLGIPVELRVEHMDGDLSKRAAGAYNRSKLRIALNRNLKGSERLDVLLHEVGHHVVWYQVMKQLGVDNVADVSEGRALEIFAEQNPELMRDLQRDFARWRLQHGKTAMKMDVRASRSPYFRVMAMLNRGSFEGEAADAYDFSMHEWLADNIAKAIAAKPETREQMGELGKFFDLVVNALKAAYEKIFGDPELAKFKAAPSIDAWVQGMFDTNVAAVQAVTGETTTPAHAEAAVSTAAQATAGGPPTDEKSWRDFIRYTMSPEAREALDSVLRRNVVLARLVKFYDNDADISKQLRGSEGMEYRIMYGFMAWQSGDFNLGESGVKGMEELRAKLGPLGRITTSADAAQKVFEDIAEGAIGALRQRDYDAMSRASKGKKGTNRIMKAARRAINAIQEPISKVFDSKQNRLLGSGVPALRQLAALLQKPQGMAATDPGFIAAARTKQGEFMREATAIMESLPERKRAIVMRAMQRQLHEGNDPKWADRSIEVRNAIAALREQADAWHAYMVEAGVLEAGQKRDYYWPVLFDTNNPSARKVLTNLYSQNKFAEAVREALGADKDAEIEDLVKDLVDGAVGAEFDTASLAPGNAEKFRAANFRISEFVYRLGDAADIKAFASVQTRNFAEILTRHIEPMVKNAEYERRFGSGKLDALLEDAKKQGASDEQLAEARDHVAAAAGTYGRDFSPVLAAISPEIAKKFSGEKTKHFVQSAQAYQNLRLLPLSLISSLVDPMGIAVRSGGDLKITWASVKDGLKLIFSKAGQAEMKKVLADMAIFDDIVPAMAMGSQFDGMENSLSTKVNEGVFKWNGMKAWVNATRFMALTAGHKFLAKHATEPNEHSQRYFEELGIEAGDIAVGEDGKVKLLTAAEREAASPEDLARDDRVRNALRQFVNEAVIRTNSQQTPLWHSDPYLGIVTQYKSFAYAMYDQIAGRVNLEAGNGNHWVWMAALSYFPIVAMAEMLRELIQYGLDGNPRRADWDATDYAVLGVARSGWVGSPLLQAGGDVIGDANRGNVPGISLLGPSVGQAEKFLTARDYGNVFEEALPASAGWKHWNDGGAQEKGQGA